jgi:glycosyltransferase involved in cell wall biosynthesis
MFLLISRTENDRITVAEALAAGTLCIVAKRTALVEFLDEPGCLGINYPPNPTKLSELILNVKKKQSKGGSAQ